MAEQLKGTVKIRVSQTVTLEHLHGLIDRIAGLSGCRPCGLGGIDLHLAADPMEMQDIAKLPGVQSITFGS